MFINGFINTNGDVVLCMMMDRGFNLFKNGGFTLASFVK